MTFAVSREGTAAKVTASPQQQKELAHLLTGLTNMHADMAVNSRKWCAFTNSSWPLSALPSAVFQSSESPKAKISCAFRVILLMQVLCPDLINAAVQHFASAIFDGLSPTPPTCRRWIWPRRCRTRPMRSRR